MIVVKEFFCLVEKKNYKIGDTYTGNRFEDLKYLLKEDKKPKKQKKVVKPNIEKK